MFNIIFFFSSWDQTWQQEKVIYLFIYLKYFTH